MSLLLVFTTTGTHLERKERREKSHAHIHPNYFQTNYWRKKKVKCGAHAPQHCFPQTQNQKGMHMHIHSFQTIQRKQKQKRLSAARMSLFFFSIFFSLFFFPTKTNTGTSKRGANAPLVCLHYSVFTTLSLLLCLYYSVLLCLYYSVFTTLSLLLRNV